MASTDAWLTQDPLPVIINNKPYPTSQTYEVHRVDSASPSVLHNVASCSPEDANAAVDACWAAFPAWRDTPYGERRKIIQKAHTLLQERLQKYAQLEVEETSSGKGFAQFDMGLAIGALEESAAVVSIALRGEIAPPQANGKRALIYREPYGVVLGIAPWNAPFTLGLRAVLNALVAGNTAVLKTSEFSPRVHLCVAQVLVDAGLPAGVLSVVHVHPKDAAPVTEALISHRAVRKINFTGSTRVGRIIAQTAAKYVKPCVLELGGKAPCIVFPDADLDTCANNIAFGGFIHQGQICMSTANVIAHSSIVEQLGSKIKALLSSNSEKFSASNRQNLAEGEEHKLRCLFSAASAERVKGLYDDAVGAGAKVVAGQAGFEGQTIQPVLLGEVNPKMRIFSEEVFGPVMSMITFETAEEAIQLANQNDAGLAASVWSKDESKAFRVARQIESGQVHINGLTVHDEQTVPHGGWKMSGYGRFNGVEGLREFTQTKTITVNPATPMPFEIM